RPPRARGRRRARGGALRRLRAGEGRLRRAASRRRVARCRLRAGDGGERSAMTAVGERAPAFALPDTSGHPHSLGGAPATAVVFTCNHCPYALAWHERLIDAARDFAPRGAVMLAINPNDAERYPRDSPEQMRARVAKGEVDGVPYLRDETQEAASA